MRRAEAVNLEPIAESQPVLPPAWGEILDNVLGTLTQTEEQVKRVEETLDANPLPQLPDAGAEQVWQAALDQLGHHFDQLQACMARAEQTAAGADALLESTEATIHDWLRQSERASMKLAPDAQTAQRPDAPHTLAPLQS